MQIARCFPLWSALAAASLWGCGSEDPARLGRPPVVLSYDPAERRLAAFVGDTLQFSLHASDPDRDVVTISFSVDGVAASLHVPWSYVVDDTGYVTVRGTASDGELSAHVEWLVHGRDVPANRPPSIGAFAPIDPTPVLIVGDRMVFSIEASDPEGDVLAYGFTVDDSLVAEDRRFEYLAQFPGSKVVRATVSDGEQFDVHGWNLQVTAPVNQPPSIIAFAPIEPDPTLIVGHTLDFTIVASDPDGDALAYRYTVDDSLVAEGPGFEYVARFPGSKLVRATVSDGEHLAAHEWSLVVTEVPDTPARVEITGHGTGVEPGEVYLEWIAVGRDGTLGLPSEYRVRTAPDPMLTEEDWDLGSEQAGVPMPAPAGELMSMTVGGLVPAQTTYLAVRALNDLGILSPLGDSPAAVTRGMRISGTVIDAETGGPVAGAQVRIDIFTAGSQADGSWEISELPRMDDAITAGDTAPSGYGAYFDVAFPYVVEHLAVTPFHLVPNRALATTLYADFLQFFRSMTDIAGNPFGTQQRRWRLPIDLCVSPYARDGLDYRATIERVAGEFDAILGTNVFRLVPARTGAGVETVCVEGLNRDTFDVTEWTEDWYPSLGVIKFRTVYTPDTALILERTARHELGHALGLNHSADINHLMVGGVAPQVDAFAAEEIAVLRCFYNIPRGFDNRWHLRR